MQKKNRMRNAFMEALLRHLAKIKKAKNLEGLQSIIEGTSTRLETQMQEREAEVNKRVTEIDFEKKDNFLVTTRKKSL